MLGDSTTTGGILFVCTGNICRSPYAERRLCQLLHAPGVPIISGGTGAVVGSDIEPETREQLRRLGADVNGFAAKAVSPQLIDGAALVLTMTRTHRGEVARLRPAAMRRIFALGDFADLCQSSTTWRPISPQSPWLPQVVAEAAAARGTVAPRDISEIDVVDPYRQSPRAHLEAFQRIDAFLGDVTAAIGGIAASPRGASLR